MRLRLCLPDAGGHLDGPMRDLFLNHMPLTDGDCDAYLVPCVWHPGFTFNPSLPQLDKPVILMDLLEFGWDYGDKENRLGHGTEQWPQHLRGEEWDKLDAWAREQPPALILKRELKQSDVTERMRPIDFPCAQPIPPIQSKAEFDARPLEVFYTWGLSNPARPRLHGDIFRGTSAGIDVLDSWQLLDKLESSNLAQTGNTRLWATIYTPHYHRAPMEQVMRYQQMAKISVSMPGAGVTCFRHGEACVGAIMALHLDNKSWSIPWIDTQNCIRLIPGAEFDDLFYSSSSLELYNIYVESQRTAERYACRRYVDEYILRAIQPVL